MADKKNTPHLYVFAGANGSGKSTVIKFFLKNKLCPLNYICPDQLVPTDKKDDVGEYIRAMEEAERRRIDNVADKNSFTFETVLSTKNKLDFINYAKAEGYIVVAIYVITSDYEINIARIKNRVTHGGHDVPVDKVISRFEKSMRLMPDVVNAAHEALIFDNSGSGPLVIFAKYIDGRYFVLKQFPEWLKKYYSREDLLKLL